MNKKKIEEVKKRFIIKQDDLEIEPDAIFDTRENRLYECRSFDMKDLCLLLNELENENERLQNDCADIAKYYQEMGRFYDEKCEEYDLLKQQLDEMWTFKTTQDGKCNILDIVRKVEREATVKKYYDKIIQAIKEVKAFESIDIKDVIFLQEKNKDIAKQLGVNIKEN